MSTLDKAPDKIAGMFDAIAGRYDTLNFVLSGGLDRRWRRHAIRSLALTGRERLLDVCTGTADLAIEAATHPAGHAREVIGIDFAGEMLRLGRRKVAAGNLTGRVMLARGDAMRLPLPDQSCEAATIAFGIRNVADPLAGCRELHRVLAPGGRLAILEFGMPTLPVVSGLYRWYFRAILPRIGRMMSRHREAYDYLPASVEAFPAGEDFVALLRKAGFQQARGVRFMVGAVYLYLATRD